MLGINDEELCQAIDAVVPDGVTHIGMVLHDVRGNIVIRQSNQPKYGVSASSRSPLIISRYAHTRPYDLTGALERLADIPLLKSAREGFEQLATGTG